MLAPRSRALASLLLWPLLSCGAGSHASKLVVTSAVAGEDGERPTLRIQFAEPVIDAAQIGTSASDALARLEPAVPLEGYWLDRQTLALTPLADLNPSTRYKVELMGELAARTENFRFDFVHQPLMVEGVWGVDIRALPQRPKLPLNFNQPVDPLAVLEHCRLRGSGDEIELVLHSGRESTRQVVVGPSVDLAQGQDFQLTCSGLSGLAGPEPIQQPFHTELATHPAIGIRSIIPDSWDTPTDDLKIEVSFTTPVELQDARAHIRAVPPIAGIDRGFLDATSTRYTAVVNLETQTEYALSIQPGLRDRYGQQLAGEYKHTFKTGAATPRISMETGIYALEASASGYPVWTRNLPHFDVDCAAVPKDKVVALLTTELNYDPWYDAGSEVDWEKIGLVHKKARIAVDGSKDNWKLESMDLAQTCGGTSKRGLYLAELSSDLIKVEDFSYEWQYRNQRRVLANVTDLGVLLKTGSTSGLVWVTSLASGKPVAGATVTLYSLKGKVIHVGTTDKSGLVKTPGANQMLNLIGAQDKDEFEAEPMSEWDLYRSRRLIAVVEHKGDMAVVDGNWNNGIQVWNFGVDEDRRGGKTRIRGFIQSDRGIYRPGETAHFKGLVREMDAGRPPKVPSQRQIAVHVEDSRGKTVLDDKVEVSAFGGFHIDVAVPAMAHLGDYHVTATIAGQTFRESFAVEEFRKVSYEVDLDGDTKHTELGAKMNFAVQADYLFGSPVADADLRWTVERRQRYVTFKEFPQYSFSDMAARGFYSFWDRDGDSYGSFVSDGEGKTDDQGRFGFSVRDPYKGLEGTYDYIATAEVTDASSQTVSKRAAVTAHPTDFYLGMHSQEWVQAVDMPFAINAVAIRPDGKRVGTTATLQLVRQDWRCTYSGGYRSHPSCSSTSVPVLERKIDIAAAGVTVEKIVPKQPGEYVIRLDTTDARGRKVSASSWVWVIGKGEAFWSGDESDRLTLIANKSEYLPGETARLVPRASMKRPTALITVERDGIVDAEVRELESTSEGIDIRLKADHAPNVYASVALVAGRTGKGDRNRPQFKMGVIDLPVSAEGERLRVEVKTDHKQVEPGQKVTGTIVVTHKGKPVRTEVALSVADEGVLQVIGFKTPDPMKRFYQSFGLGVDNAANLNRIARLNDPLGYDGDEGGDSGGEQESIRSKFVSSAYWNPELLTNERGEARFEFVAPDNLTAFRLMAVAADDGRRFGSADSRVTVTKKVLAKPMLPRFLNEGDEAVVGVIIHNHSGKPGKATVTAQVQGATLKQAQQVVTVNKSRPVVFPIVAGAGKEVRFTFRVTMDAGKDAVELAIPLHRGLHYETRTLASGVLESSQLGRISVPVQLAAYAMASDSTVSVTIDRTGIAELEPALEYLVQYPYGCLEQTLSRFVPLTKVKDLAASASFEELDGPKMNTFLAAGAAKVARHQAGNGHFSLWPAGPTYPHLTVYAAWGLSEAQRAGVEIDEGALSRALDAIATWSNQPNNQKPGGELATVAMAAYVLADAGRSDPGLVARLYKARRGLPRYGLAFLLRAMAKTGSPRADVLAVESELLAGMIRKDGHLVVKEKLADSSYYMSSDVRSSAMALSALLEVDPQSTAIDSLAEGLRASRLGSGRWTSTQDNTYALVALADYARAQKSGVTDVTVDTGTRSNVRLQGSKLFTTSLPADRAAKSIQIQAKGRARYSVRLTEASRDGLNEPENAGFSITRELRTPKGDAVTELKAGDLVVVHLEVQAPTARRWVAVVDPLPAGLEAVNTRLATSASNTRTKQSWNWTHVEMRDDRVEAFADHMNSYRNQPLVLEYLARATIKGRFRALPATVEAMYEPTVNGRTAATTIEVK